AHPAFAQRRALSAHRRGGAPAALDAYLWCRRRHRAVHRHQAHRSHPRRAPPGVTMKTLIIALRVTLVTLVVTGLIYPIVMTGLSKALLRDRANGSFVTDEKGQIVGSELLAQSFERAGYFQPRPSAAGDKGYDATSSGGSNLGPTSKKLRDRVADAVAKLK